MVRDATSPHLFNSSGATRPHERSHVAFTGVPVLMGRPGYTCQTVSISRNCLGCLRLS